MAVVDKERWSLEVIVDEPIVMIGGTGKFGGSVGLGGEFEVLSTMMLTSRSMGVVKDRAGSFVELDDCNRGSCAAGDELEGIGQQVMDQSLKEKNFGDHLQG